MSILGQTCTLSSRKGQETLNGIMELAEETQSPRAYEVAGQLLKSVADTTDKFLNLQKDLKDIKEEKKVRLMSLITLCSLVVLLSCKRCSKK